MLAFSSRSWSSMLSVVHHTVIDFLRPGIPSLGIHLCKIIGIFPSILECFAFWWSHGLVQNKLRDVILFWVIAHLTAYELILVVFCKCLGAHGFLEMFFWEIPDSCNVLSIRVPKHLQHAPPRWQWVPMVSHPSSIGSSLTCRPMHPFWRHCRCRTWQSSWPGPLGCHWGACHCTSTWSWHWLHRKQYLALLPGNVGAYNQPEIEESLF